MKHKNTAYHLINGLALFFFAAVSYAAGQSSTNYSIPWDVTDNGGGTASSASYILTDSVSQVASDQQISSNYILSSGFQATLDEDSDSVRDVVDNCRSIVNPVQLDTDADTHGDACDDFVNDPTEWLDTDGDGTGNNADTDDDDDGLTDIEEISLGTNPLLADTDGDGFDDGAEIIAGTDPLNNSSFPVIPVDGDITLDGIVDIRDILLAAQVLSGTTSLTPEQLIHADVAPLVSGSPSPDGLFTTGDFVVIQRKALGLINF